MVAMRRLNLSSNRSAPRLRSAALIILAWGLILLSSVNPFRSGTAQAADTTIDATASASSGKFHSDQPRIVFTSDQVGYVFYEDSTDSVVYSKTTDGGATWGSAVTVDAQTDAINVSIWYDQWTPGDTTGTNIYVFTTDTGSDDVWYNKLDTSTDTLQLGTSPVAITSSPGPTKTNTLTGSDQVPSGVKATDGTLYMSMQDDTASSTSYVLKCSSSCGTASNWSDAGTSPLDNVVADDTILVPMFSGNIMVIRYQATTNKYQSKIWNTSSWDASWTDIDTFGGINNSVYSGNSSATINRITGDVYFTYVTDNSAFGTNDDVRTAIYSSGSWTLKTDVITNSGTGNSCAGVTNCGLTGVKIGLNENNGDIYVVYSARTTPGTASTGQLYYKKSTDGMTTWGSEQGPLNSAAVDTAGPALSIMSPERFYVAWDDRAGNFVGTNMVDLVPPTFEQSAYRFVANANSTTAGSALAANNTAAVAVPSNQPFRLKILLHLGGDGAQANYTNFKLQYAYSNGTCDTAFSGETYNDVGGALAFYNNPTPTDGDTTVTSNDPTHSSDTVLQQTYEEANNFSLRTKVSSGQDGLWDFALIDTSHTAGAAYCFRVVRSTGSTLNTYSVIPELQQPSLSEVLRGGNSFDGGSEQGMLW